MHARAGNRLPVGLGAPAVQVMAQCKNVMNLQRFTDHACDAHTEILGNLGDAAEHARRSGCHEPQGRWRR